MMGEDTIAQPTAMFQGGTQMRPMTSIASMTSMNRPGTSGTIISSVGNQLES